MEQYISKSALVAEIENLLDKGRYHEEYDCAYRDGNNSALYALKGKIDTLKSREVDLEHEVESYWKQCDMTWCRDAYSMTHIRSMLSDIAKHFFSLGMQVSNKEQK